MLIHRPIVMFVICWLVGIYLANAFPIGKAIIIYIAIGAMLPLLLKVRRLTKGLACLYLFAIGASFLSFVLYDDAQQSELSKYMQHVQNTEQRLENSETRDGTARGMIASSPEQDGDSVQFKLKLHTWKQRESQAPAAALEELVLVNLKLSSKQELEVIEHWKYGQETTIHGSLTEPSTATNFGSFDYRAYLRSKHIYWVLKAEGAASVTIEDRSPEWSWMDIPQMGASKLEEYRQYGADLYRQLFSENESSYLEGLVLGLRSGLDPYIEQSFAQLGLTHVLAISGLHVGVFIGSCLLLLRLCRFTRETSLLIVICLIPLYVLFTGASPSVIRAGMMSMLSLIGLRQGWLRDGLHLLSAALLFMLWWEPYYALDVGFQLSFAVTAGLIVGVSPFQRMMPSRWPRWLSSSIAVTIVAQLVSFPLTIYYFNQVSLLSLLTNFILVPFISLIVLPLASITLILAVISVDIARPIAWLVTLCDQWTFTAVDWLADLEGTLIIWPKLPLWWLLMYYMLLGVLLHIRSLWEHDRQFKLLGGQDQDTVPLEEFIQVPLTRRRPWGWMIMAPCSLLLLLLLYGYTAGRPTATIISFLDVGQGDSTLIQTASGRNILIDGGGTISFIKPGDEWRMRRQPYEVGEDRLVPLLKQRGIRHLDAVILTHGDSDHAGGLRAVLRHISTDRLIMNGTWKSSALLTELYQLALEKQIPIMSWDSSDQWMLDDVTMLHVLSPILRDEAGLPHSTGADAHRLTDESHQNDASLVLMLTIHSSDAADRKGGFAMMFTGDAGVKEEKAILYAEEQKLSELSKRAAGIKPGIWPIQLDVMKVGHHGSGTSTGDAWIEHWKPSISTISAGKNNRYGHPDDNVVERLEANGSLIYRTVQDGEIQIMVLESGLKLRVKHDRMSK